MARGDQLLLLDCMFEYLEANRDAIESVLKIVYDNRDVCYFGGPPPQHRQAIWMNVALLVENRHMIACVRQLKQELL